MTPSGDASRTFTAAAQRRAAFLCRSIAAWIGSMGMLDIPSALAMDFEPKDVLKDLETWAAKQEGHPNRSQAIRRLVELGLKAKR